MKIMFFQLKYDCVHGIADQWKKFALLAIVYSILLMDFIIRCTNRGYSDICSIGDMILWIFKGAKEFDISASNILDIPTAYILPNILIAFIVGNYPFKDLNGFGQAVLVRTREKRVWWLSKCAWCILSVISSYAILMAEILFVGIYTKKFTFIPTIQVCTKISGFDKQLIEHSANFNKMAIYMLICAVLTSIAISMLQVSLSQIVSPIIGYIVVVTLLMAGVFFNSEMVITNGLMAVRNGIYMPEGYNYILIIFIDIIIIFAAIMVGLFHFVKTDIFNRSEWRIM